MKAVRILTSTFTSLSSRAISRQFARQFSTKTITSVKSQKLSSEDIRAITPVILASVVSVGIISTLSYLGETKSPGFECDLDELLGEEVSRALYKEWASFIKSAASENKNSNISEIKTKKLLDDIHSILLSLRLETLNSNLEIDKDVAKKLKQISQALFFVECTSDSWRSEESRRRKLGQMSKKYFAETIAEEKADASLRSSYNSDYTKSDKFSVVKSSQTSKNNLENTERTDSLENIKKNIRENFMLSFEGKDQETLIAEMSKKILASIIAKEKAKIGLDESCTEFEIGTKKILQNTHSVLSYLRDEILNSGFWPSENELKNLKKLSEVLQVTELALESGEEIQEKLLNIIIRKISLEVITTQKAKGSENNFDIVDIESNKFSSSGPSQTPYGQANQKEQNPSR